MATPQRSSLSNALILATALVTLATAGVSLYVSLENSGDIQDIHISINSRMDELLQVSKDKARAEGVIEGEGREPYD